jgi:GT2 family glycosyltransferase
VRTAVILSTYNAPERLKATLIGYSAQLRNDFELIVADDGSDNASKEVIRSIARDYSRPILHIWQADEGFRKCRILNQAVLATDADYLIFSDGDCIPRSDFVDAHITRARPRRFLSGGYFKLNAHTSARITPHLILEGRITDPCWLIENGTLRSHKLSKLSVKGWRAELMNLITPTRATWNGHNSSCFRSDLLRVNGFDERMQYWAQDREFGERLVNSGVRGVQIRYSAICAHIAHDRPYKTEESRERNQQIRAATKAASAVWTVYGVIKGPLPHLSAPAPARLASDIILHSFEETQQAA